MELEGKPPRPYTIAGLSVPECPVSYITGASRELVDRVQQARHIHAAFGAAPGGADSSQWDARFADAVELLEIEKIRESNARSEAIGRK